MTDGQEHSVQLYALGTAPPVAAVNPTHYLLVIPVHFHFFGKVFHETLKSYSFFGAEHLQGRSRRPCRKQTDSDQEKWPVSRRNTEVQRQGTLLCPV